MRFRLNAPYANESSFEIIFSSQAFVKDKKNFFWRTRRFELKARRFKAQRVAKEVF